MVDAFAQEHPLEVLAVVTGAEVAQHQVGEDASPLTGPGAEGHGQGRRAWPSIRR